MHENQIIERSQKFTEKPQNCESNEKKNVGDETDYIKNEKKVMNSICQTVDDDYEVALCEQNLMLNSEKPPVRYWKELTETRQKTVERLNNKIALKMELIGQLAKEHQELEGAYTELLAYAQEHLDFDLESK